MATAATAIGVSRRSSAASDTLVWDIASGPQYVDPVLGTSAQANVMVLQNVYERLVWYSGADTEPLPWLATGWEVKDDDRRYVFRLRKGVKFHDGAPFDAAAVKFSFDRAVLLDDPEGIGSFCPTGIAAPGILKGAWEFSKSFGVGKDYSQEAVDRYLAAEGVKIIDRHTVEFNLAQPYAAFLSDLATFMGSILSPAYVVAHWQKPTDPARGFIPGITAGERNEWMLYHASGSGPYVLAAFDKATANVTLNTNPDYWGGPIGKIKPALQSIFVRTRLDQATRLHDLKSGAADIADVAVNSIFEVIDRETWREEAKIQPLIPSIDAFGPYPWRTIYFAKMNFHIKNPDGSPAEFQPFRDIRVRKAFASAMDNADICRNALNGFVVPTNWGLTPTQFGYDPKVTAAYSFDLNEARRLLAAAGREAGFGPGKPRNMTIVYNAAAPWQGYAARHVAANINRCDVGLNLDVKPLAFDAYVDSWRAQLTGFSIHSTFSPTADPNCWLGSFGTGAGYWARTSSYDNPRADALYAQQFQMRDPKRRAALISQLMQAVNDDLAWIWIGAAIAYGQPTFNPNVLRSSVKGFYYNPTYQGFYFPALSKP